MSIQIIQTLQKISFLKLQSEKDFFTVFEELDSIDMSIELEDVSIIIQTIDSQRNKLLQDLKNTNKQESILSLIVDLQVLFISLKLLRKYNQLHINSIQQEMTNKLLEQQTDFLVKLIEKEYLFCQKINNFTHILIQVSRRFFEEYTKIIWGQSLQQLESMKKLIKMIIFVIFQLEIQNRSQIYANLILRRILLKEIFKSWSLRDQQQFWGEFLLTAIKEEEQSRIMYVVQIFLSSITEEKMVIQIVEQLIALKKYYILHTCINCLCPLNDSLKPQIGKFFENNYLKSQNDQSNILDFYDLQYSFIKYLKSNQNLCQQIFKKNLQLFSKQTADQQKVLLHRFVQVLYLLYESFQNMELGQYLLQTIKQIQQLSHTPTEQLTAYSQKTLKIFNQPNSFVIRTFWGPLYAMILDFQGENKQYLTDEFIIQCHHILPSNMVQSKYEQYNQKVKLNEILNQFREELRLKSPTTQDFLKLYIKENL